MWVQRIDDKKMSCDERDDNNIDRILFKWK